MSTDRLIPPEIDLGPPGIAMSEDRNGEIPQPPTELSLTTEARTARDELLSGCIAQLEQTPTADLPSEALRRLALLASEVAGSDPSFGHDSLPGDR
jgi:hypothetical protein